MSLKTEITLLNGNKTTVPTGLYIGGQWVAGKADKITLESHTCPEMLTELLASDLSILLLRRPFVKCLLVSSPVPHH
jgi:hypothetical protein